MDEITLNAQLRSESGKGTAHKLRAKGMIPGVFYLGKKINQPIQLNTHELKLILKKKPSIIRLKLDDGKEYECVVRDLQQHPVTGKSIHIDLMGIIRGQKVTVKIPIELTGSAYGVRTQGGVLQHTVHTLNIVCLPKHIPEKVVLDISELSVGSSLHVHDIEVENVKVLDDPDKTVVSVLAPRVEKEIVEEVEEEAEEEAAEAEGEGEKEEESE